jgi:dTDP-4-dehydrorhamnose 3,5-epimerase
MLSVGSKNINPTVVADQVGRLTFTSELVRAIDHLLRHQSPYGTYNVTNGGEPASWADITRAIFETAQYDAQVTDTTTEEYFANKPETAPRPLNSTLKLDKLQTTGFASIDWREDLAHYVAKEKESL